MERGGVISCVEYLLSNIDIYILVIYIYMRRQAGGGRQCLLLVCMYVCIYEVRGTSMYYMGGGLADMVCVHTCV